MNLNDVAAIVNIVGVMLVVIFTIRWGGRPPRNRVVDNIGLATIFRSIGNPPCALAQRPFVLPISGASL